MKTKFFSLLIPFLAGSLLATTSRAATYVVTSSADDGSTGTLRYLLAKVVADGDEILIPAEIGTIQLTLEGAMALDPFECHGLAGTTVVNGCADLDLRNIVTIRGGGKDKVTIAGTGEARIFEIGPEMQSSGNYPQASLTISGVTLRNGNASDVLQPDGALGGAILVNHNGHLQITDVAFVDNHAIYGGAVSLLSGFTTVKNSEFVKNHADKLGGAVYVWNMEPVSFSAIRFESNSAGERGGAIYSLCTPVELIGSTIYQNRAALGGGGVSVTQGTVTIQDTDITDNSAANGDGGGIYAEEGSLVSVENSLIENNLSDGGHAGGGIYSYAAILLINRSSIMTNKAPNGGMGGGIYIASEPDSAVPNPVSATITNSVVYGNSSDSDGGGIHVEYANLVMDNTSVEGNLLTGEGHRGGGLYNANYYSTIIRNSAFVVNDAGVGGSGGGFFHSVSSMNLSNVTISSNLAGQDGGGFQNQAPVWGSNVTIAYNTAGKDSTGGDGGGFFNRSAVSLINSIVTHNLDSSPDSEAPDCSSEGEGNPYIRTHFNGPNIMGTTTGCVIGGDFSGLSNSDPLLSIPSKNGGEPQGKDGFYIPWTHALGEGSPAVDAGDDNFCPKTDTRGMPRPMGEHCDLGAFEYDPSSASMLTKEAKSLDMQAQGCSAGSGGTSTLLAILLGMIGILALPTACRR